MSTIVIVGGGLAAQRCCEGLRRSGWDGAIQMVCAEALRPYDRPPLSKELLAAPDDPPSFRPADWYVENGVELLLGSAAASVDADARTLQLDDGRILTYERLLAATGADPLLPSAFHGFRNVHVLRDHGHAVAVAAALRPGARLAVVGAGFLGLEVAATARGLGAEVAVMDIAPTPLARVLPPVVGSWFANLHEEAGVDLHLGDGVASVRGNCGEAEELVLESGARVSCDTIVVAAGVRPATGWLAGLVEPGRPLPAGEDGTTAIGNVFAAGDITGTQQWEAAARQGAAAARAMLGLPVPAPSPPSFWTDQFGVRVQSIGRHEGADHTTSDGCQKARDFAITWWQGDRAIGGLLAGRPRDLAALRRRIQDCNSARGGEHELQGAHR
jgi:3-phenylpropionate/trans-cinnamate dioxygenase ferredoxin reductase subunit